MIPNDTLDQIRARFEFLEAKMSSGGDAQDFAALSREYSELRPVVAEIDAYREMMAEEAELLIAYFDSLVDGAVPP